jgi:hypothetical protein
MKTRSKLLLAALIAAASLATAVGTAGARRIELSEQRIRAEWREAERTKFIDSGGIFEIECQITVEGTFHSRTLSKVSGQLIGYITAAETTFRCASGGEVAILNGREPLPGGGTAANTLPWHIRYDSFTGALPSITGIRIQIIEAAIRMWKPLGPDCLYESTTAQPLYAILEVAAGTITALRWDETRSIPKLVEIVPICPPTAKLTRKSTSFTAQGSETTRIRVRLVQ